MRSPQFGRKIQLGICYSANATIALWSESDLKTNVTTRTVN